MRKILIFFILFCISSINVALATKKEQPVSKNQVVLNLDDEPTIFEKKKTQQEAANENSLQLKPQTDILQKNHNTLLYEDINHMQPKKETLSKTIDKNISPNTSVGATYKTSEKGGELDDSVSVFTKYKKDRFSFTSAYGQNKDNFKNNSAGTMSFSPEVELNKHVSVKNVYSDNRTTNQQSNEVVLSVKPFKDDKMDIDLGAGQTFSTDNQPAKSQLNLSTKIRF